MATGARAERSARERILDTASELFYHDGYHAVGIDTIVERSGVAKMTLYRHFPSKDDLIAAYLERANAEFWDWLEGEIASVDDPKAKLLAAFHATGELAASGQCMGCTFQAAASEFPALDHPGHRVARWPTSGAHSSASPSWRGRPACAIRTAWPPSSCCSWMGRGSPQGCLGRATTRRRLRMRRER